MCACPTAELNRHRFASIQGLRAVAMLLVFSHHLHSQIQLLWPNPLSAIVRQFGSAGTDLFLCLSGCFIYRSLLPAKLTYAGFLRRRLVRIYPVYAFMLGLCLALDAACGTGRLELHGDASDFVLVLKNLLFLPALLGKSPMLEASWTLAYLVVLYLAAPPLVHLLRRRSRGVRIAIISTLWLCALSLSLTSRAFPARVTLFFGGMLVWELAAFSVPAWLLLSSAGLGLLLRAAPFVEARLAGSLLFAATVLLAALVAPQFRKRLSAAPLRWLGYRSYSFYLAHGLPLLALFAYVFPHLGFAWALALQPVCFACSLAFAECVHQLVERRWSLSGDPVEFPWPADRLRAAVRAYAISHAITSCSAIGGVTISSHSPFTEK